MVVEQFNLTDKQHRERYDRLFEACPDAFIQQSTYWAEVIKDLGPDEPIFLLCRDGTEDIGGLPLYLYEHPLGNVLVSVPQAGPLGGIFFRQGLSRLEINRLYDCLLEQAQRIAQDHHCLSLSIITNPFSPDLELYQRYLAPDYLLENFTQYISLTKVLSDDGNILLRDYARRSNLSRNLKKARLAGFSVVPCDSDSDLAEFYHINVQRHLELGIEPLSFELLQNIRRFLEPRRKAYLLLVKKGDEVASGCIYIYHRHVMDVLRLIMNPKYAEQSPNYLNVKHSLLWAHSQGILTYNWQSAPSRESGVYRFKQQWGSIDVTYCFVTKLFCERERIQKMGLETLKSQYPLHYVVPYAAFVEGFDRSYFKK